MASRCCPVSWRPTSSRRRKTRSWRHFPRPEDYFADPDAAAHRALAGDQFAGVREFPYRSWDLNGLAVHPDLVDMAERYLGTPDLHLYKVELWGKYAGAVNYDQPLHRDYGSHSLVVPRPETALPADHDVHLPLRRDRGRRADRHRPLRRRQGRAFHAVVPPLWGAGRAGGALRRTGGLTPRLPDRHPAPRLELRCARPRALLHPGRLPGTRHHLGGKMAWPKAAPDRWAKFIPQCTVRQRDLFGWPRPGDPYWDESTLEGVAARYPGIDLEPYRVAVSSSA